MLLFYAGVCVEKSYEVSKLGEGGSLPEMKKINNIFFCNIMTTSYCSQCPQVLYACENIV